jgi:hypothetical protein
VGAAWSQPVVTRAVCVIASVGGDPADPHAAVVADFGNRASQRAGFVVFTITDHPLSVAHRVVL